MRRWNAASLRLRRRRRTSWAPDRERGGRPSTRAAWPRPAIGRSSNGRWRFSSCHTGAPPPDGFSHERRSVRRRQPFEAMKQWGRQMTNEHPARRAESADRKDGLDRRNLLSGLALLPVLSTSLVSAPALAQTSADAGALPSWQDGAAKQAILDFVRATTERSSAGYIPPEERIATFDQDGTLWVEHPVYTQVVY